MVGLLAYAFTLLLLLLVHEYGHAAEFKKLGFKIKAIGVGLPLPRLPHWTIQPGKFFKVALHLYPLPYAAYVQSTAKNAEGKSLAELPYSQQAMVHGAGLWGSFVCLLIIMGTAVLLRGQTATAFMLYLLAAALVFGKKIFCNGGVILASIAALCLFLNSLTTVNVGAMVSGAGYIRLAQEGYRLQMNVVDGAMNACAFYLYLGLFDGLPLPPLDGGKIALTLLGRLGVCRQTQSYFAKAGKLAVASLMVVVIGIAAFGDIRSLVG